MPTFARMKEYDSYIFDLDGTLLNTLTDLTICCNHVLRLHGFPVHTEEEVRGMVGNGIGKLIERAMPDERVASHYEKVLADFKEYYLLHSLDNTKPYDGIIDMLQALKQRGKRIAVVSNKIQEAAELLCSKIFGDKVDVVVGESENVRSKPMPDMVEKAMASIGAERNSCIYIGDSDVDILTARNSGLSCISVLWGFKSREQLIAAGATTIIESPEELIS